ncbi:MAG: extracellular solute-binding protein [bacterium]|nr:extracellular solute-binding protein [bacterium]
MKKHILMTTGLFLMCMLCGCGKSGAYHTTVSNLDTNQKVTLTIAIPYETNKALNTVANSFMTQYPNVSVNLQYVEDYDTNAVQLFKDNRLDMILQKGILNEEYMMKDEESGEKIPTGEMPDDYFYNYAADTEIDFSGTSSDISNNYRHAYINSDGAETEYIYSYPLGGETRGVFVNKTLLDTYGLSVPTNYTELLSCCETLKQNGLIPIQGGVSTAAYSLGLASAVNPVVHDETALRRMSTAEEGVSTLFEDILRKYYTLATNRYIDYKAAEENGYFTLTTELGQAQSFLGLQTDENTFEVTKPENGYGYVVFMPYISSMGTTLDTLIDEYELQTEYVFICSPMNDEGSVSPAYVTPYYGICANKNSENLVWIREFVNFIFQPEQNKIYAEEANIIPNTTDAMQVAAKQYGLDAEQDIALCGQILFSDDYNGFDPLAASLVTILKCNAQKYMVNLNLDANGNIQYETDAEGKEFLYLGNGETVIYPESVGEADPAKPGYAYCTFDYFMDDTENEFAKYRVD